MANEIGDAFVEAMPAIGTPGPTYATEIEEVIAELQERLESPVALTSLASQADNTVLARLGAGSSGAPSAVTVTALAAAMPAFAVGVTGMVVGPASGPTGKFLRDDHTWQPATVDLSGYLTTAAAAATYASYAYIAGQSYATIGDLANLVPNTLTITAGTGLVGGGDLTANRTLSLADLASGTVMANITGGSAAPVGITYASLVGVLPLASGGSRGMLPALSGIATQVLAGDGSWATLPTFNGTVTGLVPVGDGDSNKYLSADGTFTVPAGGGGGFPKTDVPLNVRTEFDGTTNNFTVRPISGDSYDNAAAERVAIKVTNHELRLYDPASYDKKERIIALDRARHRFFAWYAGTSTNFNADIGTPTAAAGGSVTSSLPTSFTDFTVENDAVFYLRSYTAASSGAIAGFWASTPLVSTPKADKTTGGFLLRAVWSPRFTTVHTTSRTLIGLTASDPRGTNQDFGALLNHLGVCLDAGDTNYCLSFRGPSGGTRQKIDLGANFVGNYATAATNRYALSIYMPRNIPNKAFVTVENLTDRIFANYVVTLSTSFDYPDPTKGLNLCCYVNNGTGVTTVPGIGLESFQVIHGV